MWRILTLWLALLMLGAEVTRSEEVGAIMAAEGGGGEEEGDAGLPGSTTVTRRQILTAQFECYLKIIHEPPRVDMGSFCNRTWDGWLCWGDTTPGTAMQLCPEYFKDFDPSEKVTKVCNSDGQWFRHPESGRLWSNYTECQLYTKDKRKFTYILYYLAMVGHGLSVVSLVISLLIFSYFKSLSCQRISLHKNLFLSLLFTSIFSVIWLSAVANNQDLVASNPISCKILSVLNQYMSGCNYFWMLCEGIYLHTLIIVAVFVGEQQLFWYYVLGWGFPIIPAAMFAVARGLFYNDNCWISINTNLPYVVQGPIQAALIVNLFFLLNIVRVMITKLKVTHSAESNTYMKAVRATLILVPLLGAQFILVPWRPSGRLAGAVYESVMQIFSNSQGLLVAIIFCFCNSEVQTALRRKWSQRKAAWGETPITSDSHGNYHSSSSVTETSRATVAMEIADPDLADVAHHHHHAHAAAAKKGRLIHRADGHSSNGKHCAVNGEAEPLHAEKTTRL